MQPIEIYPSSFGHRLTAAEVRRAVRRLRTVANSAITPYTSGVIESFRGGDTLCYHMGVAGKETETPGPMGSEASACRARWVTYLHLMIWEADGPEWEIAPDQVTEIVEKINQ